MERKKRPWQNHRICQGRIENLRCHLASQGIACALSGIPTYPRQLTYANTLQNTGYKKILYFWLYPRRSIWQLVSHPLSASRVLCTGIIAVISASSVYCMKLFWIIAPEKKLVNKKMEKILYLQKYKKRHWQRALSGVIIQHVKARASLRTQSQRRFFHCYNQIV